MIATIIFLRCFFRGHQYTKTPIVVHDAKIKLFNVQPAFTADGDPDARLAILKIGHGIHHCQFCGKTRFL